MTVTGAGGTSMVSARGLGKTYRARKGGAPFVAVDGIDFDVAPGESFGFLGPNGAGKSSTMRMIGCQSPPTAGSLAVLGLDAARNGPVIRARMGSVPQDDNLDTELTVRENLLIYGRYFRLPRAVVRERAERLLDFARLADKAADRVHALSGGMRRRLTIARSLINDPEILLLDEPTTGLDPQARHLLWERLFQLKRDGVTLILTTHYMDEAEQLCDRLVIMDGGRIVAEGPPHVLIKEHATREVLELRFDPGTQLESVERLSTIGDRVEVLPDRLLCYTDDGEAALVAATTAGLRPITSLVRRASLEDVFLRLTGRSLIE
ncbi:MAG: lipooligosaccharide transport system ATP-binding protein [Pseudonocardiales bacterium]|jgi:lipooligosaccharide transport system ATP-binding protein|nr:lipooligosaccharide transport system ATP-binding protein [Pseudonocardiales bacterium]